MSRSIPALWAITQAASSARASRARRMGLPSTEPSDGLPALNVRGEALVPTGISSASAGCTEARSADARSAQGFRLQPASSRWESEIPDFETGIPLTGYEKLLETDNSLRWPWPSEAALPARRTHELQ